jgi:nicotinamidase/pyrazinamidase
LPTETDLLLVIDVQNDFCPGGALPVPEGNAVVPIINRLARHFSHIVLTQDWHPADHASFASHYPGHRAFETITVGYGRQTLWPDHCVQGSTGAAFHPDLDLPRAELILRKGFRREIDSYSAFFENDRKTATGLAGWLRERGFRRLFLSGLATDYCVAWSALDAIAAGFEAILLPEACRAIDLEGSLAAALTAMRQAGIRIGAPELGGKLS